MIIIPLEWMIYDFMFYVCLIITKFKVYTWYEDLPFSLLFANLKRGSIKVFTKFFHFPPLFFLYDDKGEQLLIFQKYKILRSRISK